MAETAPLTADAAATAFLACIADEGWAAATLPKVAERLGVGVSDVARAGGDRWALLAHFGQMVDVAALREADALGGSQAVRDRLFTLFMARFDALAPHKAAIQALANAVPRDPGLALFFATKLPRAIALMADAAGIDTSGIVGGAKVKVLSGLYLQVVRAWFKDDSEDMAKTMKALDEALAKAEDWAQRLERRSWRKPAPMKDAA
jgi:ubiquinone biosynthesis protein COQ9